MLCSTTATKSATTPPSGDTSTTSVTSYTSKDASLCGKSSKTMECLDSTMIFGDHKTYNVVPIILSIIALLIALFAIGLATKTYRKQNEATAINAKTAATPIAHFGETVCLPCDGFGHGLGIFPHRFRNETYLRFCERVNMAGQIRNFVFERFRFRYCQDYVQPIPNSTSCLVDFVQQ